MSIKSTKDVLDFWFSDEMRPNWFAKSDEVDRKIRDEFMDTYEAAKAGKLAEWMDDPKDALALVITLDQFPRNMFRGSPRSFKTDPQALDTSRRSIDRDYDKFLDQDERKFLYMPYMHSENKAAQETGVKLFTELGDESSLDYAIQHRDIVDRFDRFPHRNAVLGRENTPEETEFLKTHKGF